MYNVQYIGKPIFYKLKIRIMFVAIVANNIKTRKPSYTNF